MPRAAVWHQFDTPAAVELGMAIPFRLEVYYNTRRIYVIGFDRLAAILLLSRGRHMAGLKSERRPRSSTAVALPSFDSASTAHATSVISCNDSVETDLTLWLTFSGHVIMNHEKSSKKPRVPGRDFLLFLPLLLSTIHNSPQQGNLNVGEFWLMQGVPESSKVIGYWPFSHTAKVEPE